MTTRELRQQLFNVADQELTVRELRAILFQAEQDEELAPLKLGQLTTPAPKVSEVVDCEWDPEWDAN